MTSQGPPAAPPPPPPRFFRPPQPGQTITAGDNTYLIGQPLGEGAFASTFACSDGWTNQLVVKVLVPRRQETYQQIRANWEREITSLLTLRHPNITYVHNAFEYQDTFYIVVERCAGPKS